MTAEKHGLSHTKISHSTAAEFRLKHIFLQIKCFFWKSLLHYDTEKILLSSSRNDKVTQLFCLNIHYNVSCVLYLCLRLSHCWLNDVSRILTDVVRALQGCFKGAVRVF